MGSVSEPGPIVPSVLTGCGKTEQGSRFDSHPFTSEFCCVHGQDEFFSNLLKLVAVRAGGAGAKLNHRHLHFSAVLCQLSYLSAEPAGRAQDAARWALPRARAGRASRSLRRRRQPQRLTKMAGITVGIQIVGWLYWSTEP